MNSSLTNAIILAGLIRCCEIPCIYGDLLMANNLNIRCGEQTAEQFCDKRAAVSGVLANSFPVIDFPSPGQYDDL